jgi:hypothetical protein
MEILNIEKKAAQDGNNLEVAEMKENIIQRAKVLLNENGELSRKVLANNWNTAEKGKILDELGGCRVDTKEAAEAYFSVAGIRDGLADKYGEKKAA